MSDKSFRYVRWFDEIGLDDVASVGGKNASLGEMVQRLGDAGIRVPPGFAVTAEAYHHWLDTTGVADRLRDLLRGLDTRNFESLADRGRRARHLILRAPLPADLRDELAAAYRALMRRIGRETSVAVRSSATAEDLPEASFAGQQESYLNVHGEQGLVDAYRHCVASLFTDRAISYRVDRGFDHFQVGLSVGVQQMVRSDLGAAGVAFTIDTESGFPDVVLINSSWGLGESVVKGRVDPDEFLVFKPTLHSHRPILKRSVGSKHEKTVYARGVGATVKTVPVPDEDRRRLSLSDDDVLTLARWSCRIEQHYGGRGGRRSPMDIEWAKDGETGELYIVQARPETVHARRDGAEMETWRLDERGEVLLEGRAVGNRIGQGPARVVRDVRDLSSFQPGEVLVVDMTDPDWEPTMKMAAAIVTNRGGRTCHAAIVSRELGVPCIVGTGRGTSALETGRPVTVSCAEGEVGRVYAGELGFTREVVKLDTKRRPRTKIMMNVGEPASALSLAAVPNDGVGLARMEFIIANSIGVHPLALLRFDELRDESARAAIVERTAGYRDRAEFFVQKLAEGVGTIAAAFHPKDVIVRMSDFKTNEYADLLGGRQFEPSESNPMLGFRGASRYDHDLYRDGFRLECRAMRQVRETFGLTNMKLMIPFCRTTTEAEGVLRVMAEEGLERGRDGLEVYVMCEIPANVVLAEEFCDLFDGFSIGSNDLTQLVLGVDRDSELLAGTFDERNPAVLRTIADVIRRVHARGRKIGICGQAPSDYPEVAEFLVAQGIDSISLTPDVVLRTTRAVLDLEAKAR